MGPVLIDTGSKSDPAMNTNKMKLQTCGMEKHMKAICFFEK